MSVHDAVTVMSPNTSEPKRPKKNSLVQAHERNGSTPLTQARRRQLARNKAKPVTPASPIASLPGGPPSLVPAQHPSVNPSPHVDAAYRPSCPMASQ
jgi:hypothetical protein